MTEKSPSSPFSFTSAKLIRAVAAFGVVASLLSTPVFALTPAATPSLPIDVAPEAPPGELLAMTAPSATTWEVDDSMSPTGTASVVQLGAAGSGSNISIDIDQTHITAQSAVLWISRAPGTVVDSQLVRIALLGDAKLEQDGVTRTGNALYVTTLIRGSIRVSSPSRVSRNLATSDTFRVADNLRSVAEMPTERLGSALVSRPAGERTPQREVNSEDVRQVPIRFSFDHASTIPGPDGKMAVLLEGNAIIIAPDVKGNYVEIRAQRAVVLTTIKSITEAEGLKTSGAPSDIITGAYMEGDVRISAVPSPTKAATFGEQRLESNRAFYDFTTGQAILTDAVLHTVDPSRNIPLVARARTIEQLSAKEFQAKNAELSTSSFAVPTYSVRASRIYIRQTDSANETEQGTTYFRGDNLTLNTLGLPIFYLPTAGGDVSNFPLRAVGIENSDRFGFGVRSEWGLYETLGRAHPKDLDVSFHADYLDNRGPATGIDANYKGGLITETTAEPWNFEGNVKSYIIHDDGTDIFGGARSDVDPDHEIRGRIMWEHQHFLPEDWQVQLRAGYISDATFLEEYFQPEFRTGLPSELSFYAKRQRDSEQLSVLATTTLNNFPTTADLVQEQTYVQRYPEIGYHRIGESVLDDRFTFFSNNTASILSFKNSTTSLLDQGYPAGISPGLPSFAQTGADETTVLRGDFRQELDYPLELGQFKVVPYVMGRYTPYSDSVYGGSENRVFAAAGTRMTTAFWRTNDTIDSELFDIHRVRHVIEPVVNLFTSGTTVDSSKLFIYDEPIDEIHDITGGQLRLEQRWQTKRGGPGRWRNVDFLTLNVEGNFFTNQPDIALFRRPEGFRGTWFDSLPETSIARNSVNADTSWRVSDTFIILGDQSWNADKGRLATAAGGFAIQAADRLSYHVEQRYIDSGTAGPGGVNTLKSNITTFGISYQISAKYTIDFSQSYDFSQANNVSSSTTIYRKFDRVTAGLSVYSDNVNDEAGFRFVLLPEGLAPRGNPALFASPTPGARR